MRGLLQPFILLALAIAIATAAIYYSHRSVLNAKAQVNAKEILLKEALAKVQQSDTERGVIERYVAPYLELEALGIVGDEKRIRWIDALRAANGDADLYGVEYELGPQQPFAFTSEAGAESLLVNQSIMKMRINLLHEVDLLQFFQALQAQKIGRFTVNSCDLSRLPGASPVPVNQPTLKAECEIAWITIAGPIAEERQS
jgi:hypothetical protein